MNNSRISSSRTYRKKPEMNPFSALEHATDEDAFGFRRLEANDRVKRTQEREKNVSTSRRTVPKSLQHNRTPIGGVFDNGAASRITQRLHTPGRVHTSLSKARFVSPSHLY